MTQVHARKMRRGSRGFVTPIEGCVENVRGWGKPCNIPANVAGQLGYKGRQGGREIRQELG